jgi:hypothetical protein
MLTPCRVSLGSDTIEVEFTALRSIVQDTLSSRLSIRSRSEAQLRSHTGKVTKVQQFFSLSGYTDFRRP